MLLALLLAIVPQSEVLTGRDIAEPPAEWRDEWETWMLGRLAKHLKTTAGTTTTKKTRI